MTMEPPKMAVCPMFFPQALEHAVWQLLAIFEGAQRVSDAGDSWEVVHLAVVIDQYWGVP